MSSYSILDNAMTTIEIVHRVKPKVKVNQGNVAHRLYISKSYDRLDFDYVVCLNYGLLRHC